MFAISAPLLVTSRIDIWPPSTVTSFEPSTLNDARFQLHVGPAEPVGSMSASPVATSNAPPTPSKPLNVIAILVPSRDSVWQPMHAPPSGLVWYSWVGGLSGCATS